MEILTALTNRSPRFNSLHMSRRLARARTRQIIEMIVETNIEQIAFTETRFVTSARTSEFRGVRQFRLISLQINGFEGDRVSFSNYLIQRFPNITTLIIAPPVLMQGNPALINNINRPPTLLFLSL